MVGFGEVVVLVLEVEGLCNLAFGVGLGDVLDLEEEVCVGVLVDEGVVVDSSQGPLPLISGMTVDVGMLPLAEDNWAGVGAHSGARLSLRFSVACNRIGQ